MIGCCCCQLQSLRLLRSKQGVVNCRPAAGAGRHLLFSAVASCAVSDGHPLQLGFGVRKTKHNMLQFVSAWGVANCRPSSPLEQLLPVHNVNSVQLKGEQDPLQQLTTCYRTQGNTVLCSSRVHLSCFPEVNLCFDQFAS